MIVRCAYLEGDVAPENRRRFDDFMAREILPMMLQFPGVKSARIMRCESVEDGGPRIYMSFESIYASLEAMEHAFAQPIRQAFKAKLAEIMPLFSGRLFHITQALLVDAENAGNAGNVPEVS